MMKKLMAELWVGFRYTAWVLYGAVFASVALDLHYYDRRYWGLFIPMIVLVAMREKR